MKRNPVYKRLLRIEITLILLLFLCTLIMKSCFGPHHGRARSRQEVVAITEPVVLPEERSALQTPVDLSETPERPDKGSPPKELLMAEEYIGFASYYQDAFHGHPTASGEAYDLTQYTAAHRELPFGTEVRVTNIENGRQVTVRINDRGPNKQERIIDLSGQAAKAIGLIETGISQVKLEVLN